MNVDKHIGLLGAELCPLNSYVETLTPIVNVTVFGDRAFKEMIKLK